MVALVLTLTCMGLITIGRWMRPAIIVGVLAYAQLGHLFPPGDRAIDRIVRCGLLIPVQPGRQGPGLEMYTHASHTCMAGASDALSLGFGLPLSRSL